MAWVLLALGGAAFTSLTSILAKIGIKDVNSNFATAFRTGIVIIMSLIVCLISGSMYDWSVFTWQNWLFLILSGLMTGCSWLCYYKALQLGTVNQVTPVDKSSFILTDVLFLIFFYEDTTNGGNILTLCMILLAMVLMLVGTYLMIQKKEGEEKKEGYKWLIYAIMSAVFAALVNFFVKLGLHGTPSDLGTFVRTIVVFIFASLIVIFRKDYKGASKIKVKSWVFLILSGIATGGAWLCENFALNYAGSNPIAVNAISKLSILLTMLLSFLILKEKFNWKSVLGLGFLTGGIVLTIVFSL